MNSSSWCFVNLANSPSKLICRNRKLNTIRFSSSSLLCLEYISLPRFFLFCYLHVLASLRFTDLMHISGDCAYEIHIAVALFGARDFHMPMRLVDTVGMAKETWSRSDTSARVGS